VYESAEDGFRFLAIEGGTTNPGLKLRVIANLLLGRNFDSLVN
jgi:hypothetical protein